MTRPTDSAPADMTSPIAKPTGTRRRGHFHQRGACPMSTRTARALADRDAYLDAVGAANVLAPNQLERAATIPGRTAAEFAAALVATGLLTRFQADRLLSGRTDGFALGPYVILEPIGRGPTSRVYKARHRTMNRAVAVKVLAAERTRTAEDRQRFQERVRAAGRLSHPNIVTAFDANELHDRFYLVLELVNGPSLDALVRQRGPLPVDEACELVRQIAHGLHHAHERGLAHGNLTPGNVLVARPEASGPPVVKITDFALPRADTGASAFLAPEAASEPHADPRADLYSLGSLFFFLLTGHPPFAGTSEELAHAQHSHAAPRVAALRFDVRPELGAIVDRLLARHPEMRFTSAAELLAHLDAVCVPVAIPMDCVSFDMPPGAPYASGSGYLTGHHSDPHSSSHSLPLGAFVLPAVEPEPSPWAQLTESMAADPTEPGLDDTPAPPPHRAPRLKPPRSAEPVPLWMLAVLLVSVVLLSLMGIAAVGKFLGK